MNFALQGTLTASSEKEAKISIVNIETEPNQSKPDGASVKEVSRTFTYEAGNVADQSNSTRWMALEGDQEPWIMIDLGTVKKLSESHMAFIHPTEGHRWMLEKSIDGINWKKCASQDELAFRSPHITRKIGKARYLRLSIIEGSAGLWEWKIYP